MRGRNVAVIMAATWVVNTVTFFPHYVNAQESVADRQLYQSVHVLEGQDKNDEAMTLLNNTISSGGSAMAYALRCQLNLLLQQIDRARPDCARALQMDQKIPFVHAAQADLLYDSGDPKSALKEYDAYIALAPSDEYGYWARCDARRLTEDWTGAQADCDKAFSISPNDPRVRVSRGRIEIQNQAYDKAYADFTFAVTAEPTNTIALYWRGYTALQMKQYDKAIDDFNAGIKLGDDSPDTYFDRSRAYRGLGKTDLAKADWETGIMLDRKYGHCNEANAMATLEMLLFGGNQVTVVACK